MEPTLSLPLRVEADGQLAREEDPVDSLLRLFRVMAATPAGSWPHARWFGLQEVFAKANPLLLDQQHIADALNRALAGLDVHWVRVHFVNTAQAERPQEQMTGERHFHIALVVDGRLEHTSLSV